MTSNGKLTPNKHTVIDWDNVPIIGYNIRENGIYEAIQQPDRLIYTHSFILCSECRNAISGHGGPSYTAICLNCYGTHNLKLFAEGKLIEDYTKTIKEYTNPQG